MHGRVLESFLPLAQCQDEEIRTRGSYVGPKGILITLLPLRRRRGQASDLEDTLNSCGGVNRRLPGRQRIWGAAVFYLP